MGITHVTIGTWEGNEERRVGGKQRKGRERLGSLSDWNQLIGDEHEIALLEHALGEVAHDRLGLDVQVAKHFV